MLFNVSSLVQEGIGATRRYEVQDFLVTEDRGSEPVTGSVEFVRVTKAVLVRAHLKIEEDETCSRCLQPLQELVTVEFEEEFKQVIEARGGLALDGLPAVETFFIDERHTLDLTEAVRQYREAAAVMQPLCKPDCKGLCPECGGDLNAETCRCNEGIIDSRWASLRSVITEGKE